MNLVLARERAVGAQRGPFQGLGERPQIEAQIRADVAGERALRHHDQVGRLPLRQRGANVGEPPARVTEAGRHLERANLHPWVTCSVVARAIAAATASAWIAISRSNPVDGCW